MEQRLGISARKHLTATHVRAVLELPEDQQKELLDRHPAIWWLRRVGSVVRCALRYWVGRLVSSPAKKMPRAVRHRRDLAHQLESMRLAWSGETSAATDPSAKRHSKRSDT